MQDESVGIVGDALQAPSPITKQLSNLEENLSLLHKSIAVLTQKISNTLSEPYEKSEPETDKSIGGSSHLTRALDNYNARVDEATRLIINLTERIEF